MRRWLTQLRRAVAGAAVLLSVSAATATPVLASTAGEASGLQAVTSGTWQATPSATTFTFAASGVPAPQYFRVTNSGTLDLTGATYALSVTGLSVGTVSVRACTVAWNETLHVCPGTVTTIVTNSNSPQSVTGLSPYPASSGTSIRLQINDTGANVGTVTAILTVSVSRSQARAATTRSPRVAAIVSA